MKITPKSSVINKQKGSVCVKRMGSGEQPTQELEKWLRRDSNHRLRKDHRSESRSAGARIQGEGTPFCYRLYGRVVCLTGNPFCFLLSMVRAEVLGLQLPRRIHEYQYWNLIDIAESYHVLGIDDPDMVTRYIRSLMI